MTVLADTTVSTARKLLLANTTDAAKMSVHLARAHVPRWMGRKYSEKEKIAAFIDEALPSLDAVAKAAIPNVRHTTMDAVMACLFRTISSFCFVGFRLCAFVFCSTI